MTRVRRVLASVGVVTALAVAGSISMMTSASAAPRATGISTDGDYGCAVMVNHSVECWGYNGYGELGNGTTTNSPVPVHVLGITQAVAVSAGEYHACAVLSGGGIKCWGYNGYGELGNGSIADSDAPVAVIGISHATKVAAGSYHSCALLTSGGVKCWGYNGYGALGNGTTTDRHTPAQVSGILKGATWVSAGDYHTCAVQSKVVKCWGYNDYGQLGDGTFVDKHLPHKVSVLGPHASIVSAGYGDTCALVATPKQGNAAWCWGYNAEGETGHGTNTTYAPKPVTVVGMQTHVTSISERYYTACAVRMGTAKCWGYNSYGEVGDGTTTDRHLARNVVGLSVGVVKVAVGYYSSCAQLTTGEVKCWGHNPYGDLGDNNAPNDSLVPVHVHLI
jgi:alpha-tubulin suppressor-like RCC1 family protein